MLAEDLGRYRIILASRSPRRQELLRELGIAFDVVVRDWNEEYPDGIQGENIAIYVAEEKAKTFIPDIKPDEIVITADTIVWCEGQVLDKPGNDEDAIRILKAVSGKTHDVITAVCLLSSFRMKSFYSSTKVTFTELSDDELLYYVKNYKPFDKAGAYGIQEWIGLAACSSIDGSYFNVMGLPSEKLYHELADFIRQD